MSFRGDEDPPIYAPGNLSFSRTIRDIIESPGIIVHPTSDHSGYITVLSREKSIIETIQQGDAAIVKTVKGTLTHVAIRTRDCGQILGFSKQGWIFGIHSSNQTEFGFQSDSLFMGPITKRTFDYLRGLEVQPADCQIYIGPSLGGKATDGCNCYEYTESPNQPDGTRLVQCIQKYYPNLDLSGTLSRRVNRDKLYFDWGEIMQRILLLIGVPERNIHWESNYCTRCEPGWHSDRRSRHEQSDPKLRPNNLGWVTAQL